MKASEQYLPYETYTFLKVEIKPCSTRYSDQESDQGARRSRCKRTDTLSKLGVPLPIPSLLSKGWVAAGGTISENFGATVFRAPDEFTTHIRHLIRTSAGPVVSIGC